MKKLLLVSLCFLVLCVTQVFAQNRTITGTVSGQEDGQPIPGVTVKIKGTNTGVPTDVSGKYSISAPAGSTLVFSFISYVTQEVPVGDRSVINVSLAQDNRQLNEVLVIGYGQTTKQAYVGSAQSVSGEELEKKRVDNVTQALAGEVAGVRVVNTSGQPGTVATVRVRGFGSINGNRDPLYVLDGVPFNGDLNSINPEDVESTTVLKDATATAIYGSRGSAGVILITTKSGKNKKPYVEANVNFGTNRNLIPRYNVITSPEQYVGLAWEGLYNQARAQGAADPVATANANLFDVDAGGFDASYNIWNLAGNVLVDPATHMVKSSAVRKYTPEKWADYAFQSAARTEANVSLGGGTDKSGYFMSLGYEDSKGYSIASDFQRLTGRLNLNNQIKPWLEAKMTSNFAHSKQNVGGQTSDSGSIFWFVDNMPPIYGLFLRDANGAKVTDPIFGGYQYDYGENNRGFAGLTNSIADTKYNTNRNDKNEFSGSAALNATIIPGLTFENTFGLQYYDQLNTQRTNKYYGSAASQHGSIFLDRDIVTNWDLTDLVRYRKSFGDHNFEAFAAHEATRWAHNNQQDYKYNLVLNDSESLNNAVVSTPASSYTEANVLESYFGQIDYNYKEKYFLLGTIRRDGSSKFVNQKWGTFGSVGAGWLVSSEDFMKDQTLFRTLKLKASYGIIGDIGGVGNYAGYTTSTIANSNDNISLSAPTPGNPNLTWESSKSFNAGVEFEVGNYLSGSVEYYIKNARNQIFNVRTPISDGYATLTKNAGGLRNSGFEFDLTGHILKTKDYHVDLNVNGEILKNKITKMPIDPSTGKQQTISPQGNYGWSVGHSIYDYYIRKATGVNPANGKQTWDAYYVDLNGDGQAKSGAIETGAGEYVTNLTAYLAAHPENAGKIKETTTETFTNAALQYTGQSAIPSVRGGINLTAGYKGFDVSVQFIYSLGGYGYDSAYQSLMANGTTGNNNWSTDILKRWQNPGDKTDVPRLSNNYDVNSTSTSTRWLIKANYLQLNNVRLSYTFGKGMTSKWGVSNLGIFVSGDNLWLASARKGYNPNIADNGVTSQYNYAPLSTLSAGLNVKF